VDLFKSLVNNTKVRKILAFANNHYAGHASDTVKLLWNFWHGGKAYAIIGFRSSPPFSS
jgi:hypothetical protein